MKAFKAAAPCIVALVVACGGSRVDARYPERERGCAVKEYPGDPKMPVDDLGVVDVECPADAARCERDLLDEVCRRGGDVAYGAGLNALNATKLVARAAHTKRAAEGAKQRGCAVQAFTDPPTIKTENIGPVVAICAEGDSRDVCMRELEDQVCLLGGDVLWQVDGPTPEGNKQKMHGRAAHTK